MQVGNTVVFQLWIHTNFNRASGYITWGKASNRKFSSTHFELTTLTLWCSGMMQGDFRFVGETSTKRGLIQNMASFFCTWEGNHFLILTQFNQTRLFDYERFCSSILLLRQVRLKTQMEAGTEWSFVSC